MKSIQVSRECWDAMVADNKAGTYFHTSTWGEAVNAEFSWDFNPLIFECPHAAKYQVAVFANANELQLGPIGYGGVLLPKYSQCCACVNKLLDMIVSLTKKPISRIAWPGQAPSCLTKYRSTEHVNTQRILIHSDWTRHWESPELSKARRDARAAGRKGVEVGRAATFDADALFPVYEETMARVGAAYRTPARFFKRVVEDDPVNTYLITAKLGGETTAWGLYLRSGTNAMHWVMAYNATGGRKLAVDAVMAEALHRLADDGCTNIDLGLSRTDGQIKAKKKWGAHPSRIDRYRL